MTGVVLGGPQNRQSIPILCGSTCCQNLMCTRCLKLINCSISYMRLNLLDRILRRDIGRIPWLPCLWQKVFCSVQLIHARVSGQQVGGPYSLLLLAQESVHPLFRPHNALVHHVNDGNKYTASLLDEQFHKLWRAMEQGHDQELLCEKSQIIRG